VEFADDGEAFDPTLAPAKRINGPTHDFEIGGYGTGLMQKFSRRMSYRRFEGMNRLVLEFDAGRNVNTSRDHLSAP
jgi:anti-sigma regulatory factor (Ser/Thr protein kinase)